MNLEQMYFSLRWKRNIIPAEDFCLQILTLGVRKSGEGKGVTSPEKSRRKVGLGWKGVHSEQKYFQGSYHIPKRRGQTSRVHWGLAAVGLHMPFLDAEGITRWVILFPPPILFWIAGGGRVSGTCHLLPTLVFSTLVLSFFAWERRRMFRVRRKKRIWAPHLGTEKEGRRWQEGDGNVGKVKWGESFIKASALQPRGWQQGEQGCCTALEGWAR